MEFHSNLAPGGWVEFQDWDGNLYSQDGSIEGTSMKQYFDAIIPAMEKTGKDPSPGPKYKRWLQAAGFRDIEVQKFVIPVGAWPKDKRLVSIVTILSSPLTLASSFFFPANARSPTKKEISRHLELITI